MKKENRFLTVYKEGSFLSTLNIILIDQETGVNYLFTATGHAGGLTPLLNADGNPVITPQK